MWKIQERRDAERERERRIRWRETEMKRRMKEVIKEERKNTERGDLYSSSSGSSSLREHFSPQ